MCRGAAPYVQFGILGERNADITAWERRRFTDLKIMIIEISARLFFCCHFIFESFSIIKDWATFETSAVPLVLNVAGYVLGVLAALSNRKCLSSISLLCSLFMNFLIFHAYSDWIDIIRYVSLTGCIVLQSTSSTMFKVFPVSIIRTLLIFSARILLSLYFITLIEMRFDMFHMLVNISSGVSLVFLVFGVKTKWTARGAVLGIAIHNLIHNDFYFSSNNQPIRHDSLSKEFLQDIFFIQLTIIGGLLQLSLQQNEIGLDGYQKRRHLNADVEMGQLRYPMVTNQAAASVTVEVPSASIGFIKPLQDQTVKKKDDAVLEVETDKPAKTIKWYKNGDEIRPGTAKAEPKKISDTKYRLEIPETDLDDTADYTVKVTDDDDQGADSSCHLTVKLPAIEIVKGLDDQTVDEGDNVVMEIETNEKPKQVKWYKNGKEVQPGDKAQPKQVSDTKYQLLVPDAGEDDNADFKVKVTDDDDQGPDSSCHLTVKLPAIEIVKGLDDQTVDEGDNVPKFLKPMRGLEVVKGELAELTCTTNCRDYEENQPFFTKGLVDQWIDRGETLTFHCEVTGDPAPEIKWYRNGMLLKPSNRVTIENLPNGECTLVIKDCTMNDEGVYRCEAENPLGKAKTQATAHVEMNLSQVEKKKVETGEPPRFIIPLEDMTVLVGSTIDLECKVTGVPMPSLKWLKDGGPLFEDFRFEWENNPNAETYQLRIRDATVNDEGTYRCVANNESGSATSKSFIRIKNSTHKHGFKNTACQVNMLTKNEEDVSPKKYELEINKAQLDDGATYKVVLSNKAGSCDSDAALTVTKPSVVKIVKGLQDTTVDQGQPLELSCKVEGTPRSCKWYKNGEEVVPDDRVQLKSNPETGDYSLLIPNSVPTDGANAFLSDLDNYPTPFSPGIKRSALSPSQEHAMSVVIATRGKDGETEPLDKEGTKEMPGMPSGDKTKETGGQSESKCQVKLSKLLQAQQIPDEFSTTTAGIATRGKDGETEPLDKEGTKEMAGMPSGDKVKETGAQDTPGAMDRAGPGDKPKAMPPKDNDEWKKKYRPTPDAEYDLLMGEVARIKSNINAIAIPVFAGETAVLDGMITGVLKPDVKYQGNEDFPEGSPV